MLLCTSVKQVSGIKVYLYVLMVTGVIYILFFAVPSASANIFVYCFCKDPQGTSLMMCTWASRRCILHTIYKIYYIVFGGLSPCIPLMLQLIFGSEGLWTVHIAMFA